MSANFTPNQNEYKNLTPFKNWLLLQINTWGQNNFPFVESDFDELTNYGMMQKLMGAVNDVISNENEVEEDMTHLFNAFTELQTYVNNYFDNLDVQDEINQKLDEMAQDGSLTALIKNYIDPIQEQFENEVNETLEQQTERIQTNQNSIATLSSRMDTFTNLTDGSTSGDAELQDIRVDSFGHTYASAGASVRGQEQQNYNVTYGLLENILEPITLLSTDWQFGDINSSNGQLINVQTRIRTKNAIKVSKGSIIKLSTYTNRYFKINYFKSEIVSRNNWLGIEGTGNLQDTYVIPQNGYIVISIIAPSSETISDTSDLSDLFTGILYKIDDDIQKTFTMANVPNYLTPILCNNPINYNTTTHVMTFPSSCRAVHWKYGSSLNAFTSINLANLTYDFTGKQACNLWYDTINSELITTNYYEMQINSEMINNSDYALLCVIYVTANQITMNAPYSIDGNKYGISINNISDVNVKEINHVAQFYSDKLPTYWLRNANNYTNYLADKITSVEKRGLYNTIFITDTHYNSNQKHSFDLIGAIKDRLSIQNIMFGGDLIGQESTSQIGLYKLKEHQTDALNRFGNSFKFIFGNHDLNVANLPGSATDAEVEAHALTYEQIYDNCILPFKNDVTFESTNLTGEEFYRNQLHYYFDDDVYKIRNIVLDSGTTHDLLGDGGTPGRLRFQYNWLADVLSNTPANYNVCVFVHEVFGSYENNAGVITGYGTWLAQILKGAKNKTSVSFTDYSGTTYSYDFSNINTINIVGVFSGHIHIDYLTTIETIPFVVTTKDCIGSVPSWGSIPMTPGTTTEQAFDIISIDTTNRMCYLTRIGAGNNRQFEY